VKFCSFRITNTYLATGNVTEIKCPNSGGKFSSPPPVVILDTGSKLTERWGGIGGLAAEGGGNKGSRNVDRYCELAALKEFHFTF
jgi:hypothetical protein